MHFCWVNSLILYVYLAVGIAKRAGVKVGADRVEQQDGRRNMSVSRAGLIFERLDKCRHLGMERIFRENHWEALYVVYCITSHTKGLNYFSEHLESYLCFHFLRLCAEAQPPGPWLLFRILVNKPLVQVQISFTLLAFPIH